MYADPRRILALIFLATVAAGLTTDVVARLLGKAPGNIELDMAALAPRAVSLADRGLLEWIGQSLPQVERLKAFEDDLQTSSLTQQILRPTVAVSRLRLGAGNTRVIIGRDNWLFYQPDLSHLLGPVSPVQITEAAAALTDLQRQLQPYGIALLVVPIPVKPVLYPHRLSSRFSAADSPLPDPAVRDLGLALDAASVPWIELADLLAPAPSGREFFLARDTHWTPAGVVRAAGRIHDWIRVHIPNLAAKAPTPPAATRQTRANTGDTSRLLALPSGHPAATAERVEVLVPAVSTPDESPPILLLGDSFTNIYSMEALGWGAGAGLAEQIEARTGQSLLSIARNDGAATAVRAALARRLRRDPSLLSELQLVIYQFSARELSTGSWEQLPVVPLAGGSATPVN